MNIIKEKLKRLFDTGAIHITLGTFATKFVAFFGSIFVVRLLTKEEYGLVSYVENIYSYALIFAGLGLCNAILRYVIIAEDSKKKSYFNFVIKNSILRDVIITALIIVINFWVKYPDSFSDAKKWVPVIALLLPLQDLVNNDLFTLRALFKNKAFAYLSFAVSVSLILGRMMGAYLFQVGGVLWSRVIINGIFAVCMYVYVSRLFPAVRSESISSLDKRTANTYALQYMITNGLWAIFMLNDTFILGAFCNDPSILADYKVAYVLPGNVSIFASAIGMYVGPYFTKNENDYSWIRRNYKKVLLGSATIVGVVTLILYVFAKPIIILMYGNNYVNTVGLMRILLLAAFLNSGIRYVSANLLSAMGQVKYNMVISAGGMALQISLDIILVQKMQAVGVAVSSCIVYAMMAVSVTLIFYKKYFSK